MLPPSEGKADGGRARPWRPASGRYGRSLASSRQTVVDALVAAGGGDERLLGMTGAGLEKAQAANFAVLGAPTLPVWQRFTGVVWSHLDVGTLDSDGRRRAQQSILVVSALAGLSGIADPLPAFRLKLSVALDPLGRLDRYWRPAVSATLGRALRGRTVIDLLPKEHRAAWEPEPDRHGYDLLRVSLRAAGKGRTRRATGPAVGHGAKAAKGLLARALVNSTDPLATLGGFTHDGLRPVVD